MITLKFQSTPPVKAATHNRSLPSSPTPISIHAAREGGDRVGRGGSLERRISIHAAREGGDGGGWEVVKVPADFNPRRP